MSSKRRRGVKGASSFQELYGEAEKQPAYWLAHCESYEELAYELARRCGLLATLWSAAHRVVALDHEPRPQEYLSDLAWAGAAEAWRDLREAVEVTRPVPARASETP